MWDFIEEFERMRTKIASLEDVINEVVTILTQEAGPEAVEEVIEEPIALDYSHLPALTQASVYYHDNGVPAPRGKTTYGLVLDVENSQYRWNINFEICTPRHFEALMLDPDRTPEEVSVMQRALECFTNYTLQPNDKKFLTYSRRNLTPGKASVYKLDPDFTVCSVLRVRDKATAPEAYVFYGDKTLYLPENKWFSPKSRNPTLRWMSKL